MVDYLTSSLNLEAEIITFLGIASYKSELVYTIINLYQKQHSV